MSSRRDRRRHAAPQFAGRTLDAEALFRPADAKVERKTRQLCREVERTLSCALGDCRDALLRELVVVGVEPAPDASRLAVRVLLPPADVDGRLVREHLERMRGHLREEVARAVSRKRAPELTFELAAPETT